MTVLLCIIVFTLILIEIDLTHIHTAMGQIANNLKAIEALARSADRIENRLYTIERQMGKEVDE